MHASRLMLLLCGSGLPTRGYRFERTTEQELSAMAQALRTRDGAQSSDAQSVTLIEIDTRKSNTHCCQSRLPRTGRNKSCLTGRCF